MSRPAVSIPDKLCLKSAEVAALLSISLEDVSALEDQGLLRRLSVLPVFARVDVEALVESLRRTPKPNYDDPQTSNTQLVRGPGDHKGAAKELLRKLA